MNKAKHPRRRVTFEDPDDQEALIQAQIGIGNREISRVTGLSGSQITYRLSQAKRRLGREHGFRVDWRNGNHPLFKRMLSDYSAIMRKEIERRIVPQIVHPTPKAVTIQK